MPAFEFQGQSSVCGANSMAVDRREAGGIALQLPSLVHCWFMWEMFRLKQAQ